MFFGLANSPPSFQRMIDTRFRDLLLSGCIFIYVDDIIIAGDTIAELDHWTVKILDRMQEAGLSAKPVKCQFERESVIYLGNYLKAGETSTNPAKIHAIIQWPTPTKLRHVEQFLGMMNFWRRYIKDFSRIAKPLNELKKKGTQFTWEKPHQDAFEGLKNAITTAPVLKIPRHDLPYLLETDASGFAIGAVLSQPHDDKYFPVGFYSRTMMAAERNYPTHDAELLAIVDALEEWRHLLEGAKHEIIIQTDNLALTYFSTSHHLSRRQARWSEYLARFHFKIQYRPGIRNKADGLSRRPDHQPEMDTDNSDQILLPKELFIEAIITLQAPEFMERFRHHQPYPSAIDAKLRDPQSLWTDKDGVIRNVETRIVVPENVALRTEIIRVAHDEPHSGHQGLMKTLDLLKRDFYWETMGQDVKEYIDSCIPCQQTKVIRA